MYLNIRGLREDNDLLQKDLAKHLNCSQVCYSLYENGQRDIPTDVLIQLSQFYDVSVDYLLGLTPEPRPYQRTHKRKGLPAEVVSRLQARIERRQNRT